MEEKSHGEKIEVVRENGESTGAIYLKFIYKKIKTKTKTDKAEVVVRGSSLECFF